MAAILPSVLRERATSGLTLGGITPREVEDLAERTVLHPLNSGLSHVQQRRAEGAAVCGGTGLAH